MIWETVYDVEGDYGRWRSGDFMIQRFWHENGSWQNNPYHVLYHHHKRVSRWASLADAKAHAEDLNHG